jgi:hypothetical protein
MMELDPTVILGPFLESVGKAQELVQHTLGLPLTQVDRELLEGFQQEIKDKKSLVENLGPQFLQKSSQGLNDGMRRLEELQKEKGQVLQQLDQLKKQAEAGADEARKAAEEHAKQPRRPIPVPTAKLPEPAKPLELSDGGVLRELLLPTAAQPVAQAPKVAGNIWENWRKVGEAPTEDDELGPEEDLEG